MAQLAASSKTESTGLLTDFATKKDLAREFNVSPRTIERWVRLRLLPRPIRLGRTTLFHLPTVRDSLAKNAAGSRGRSSRR